MMIQGIIGLFLGMFVTVFALSLCAMASDKKGQDNEMDVL